MKPIILLLALSVFHLTSCRQKNVEPGECKFKTLVGSSKKLEGKWKLVTVTTSGFSIEGVKVYDHTCDDIIHEYREDGTLIIYKDGVQENERNYTVEREKDKIIKISGWDAQVTSTKLTIDSRSGDGPLEEYYRVK